MKSSPPSPLTYRVRPGTTIDEACKHACELAASKQQPVQFAFNDTQLVATPTSNATDLATLFWQGRAKESTIYKASAEGKRQAAREKADLAVQQKKMDALMARFDKALRNDKDDSPVLLNWLAGLAEVGDRVGIKWDKKRVSVGLRGVGYIANDACELPSAAYEYPKTFKRYIIGQCLACLQDDMSPHSVTSRFVKDYRKLIAS